MDEISTDLVKLINALEQSYKIYFTIHNTTVIRNKRGRAIHAYSEIKGLTAKSLDKTVELTLYFHLLHETPKDGNRIRKVEVLPDTPEANERVNQDISAAYSTFKQ